MYTRYKAASLRQATLVVAMVAAQLGIASAAQASCGSTFCGVNTHWDAQGLWDKPGLRADLRFEFIDQDQPRHGSDDVAVGEIPREEDEVRTLNRNTLLNLDYGIDARWGVSVSLPHVNRSHDHIVNEGVEPEPESLDVSELGDVRVLGRYRMSDAGGVKFGMKLPSGDYTVASDTGAPIERTFQPGSGTTDVILGGYYQIPMHGNSLRGFSQALWQQPLNERDDFKPGYTLSIDGGVNYSVTARLSALLQTNVQIKGRDSGVAADRTDSGARTVALSPGIGYALTRATQVYGFVQLPVYEYVNGVQLTADVAYVAGVSAVF